jgi:hypothetical protein
VLLAPVLVLVEVQALRDALAGARPGHGAGATRFVLVVLAAALPLALAGGWRRGRRPLNPRPRPYGASRFWAVGLVAAFVTRAISPNGQVWLHATLLVLVSVGTAVFVGALASRVAHGALSGSPADPPPPAE